MLKRFVVLLFAWLSCAAGNFVGAAEAVLRIGDGSNGAPLTLFQKQALDLALAGRGKVTMKRVLPSRAAAALREGEFDLIVLDARFRPPADAGLRTRPYAAEALCVYVHPGNPSGSLTPAEVLNLLTEARPRWSKFGPRAADVQRITLKSDMPETTLIRRVFGERNYAPEVFRVGSMAQMFAFLNPAAVGFGPFVPERGAEIIALPVNDVAPDTAAVLSGRYPLTLHYWIVTGNSDSPLLAEFLSTVFSPESRRMLPETGLLPIWEVQR